MALNGIEPTTMDSDLKKKRDNELFLKAFEKPTQIYRYMRLRHRYSPIYLHRNLSYLRGRAVRGKSLRQPTFDWRELWDRAEGQQNNKININQSQSDFLVFKFYGCFDEKVVGAQTARIDIYSIPKHGRYSKILLSSIPVEINPVTLQSNLVQVTVPKEKLENSMNIKHKSSHLLLEVSYNGSDGDESTRSKKRKKVSYEAQINIFDDKGRCILFEGEYELLLRNNPIESNKHKAKDSIWQDIPIGFGTFFKGSPTLKFFLFWSNQDQLNSTASQHLLLYGSKTGIKSSSSSLLSSASSSCSASSTSTSSLSTSGISSDMTEDVELTTAAAIGTVTSIKKTQTKTQTPTSCVEMENINSNLVYRFIYNNNLSQQTEACDNFNCPWCYLNCMCLKSLLMHLRFCHDRFTFSVVQKENRVHIDVRINDDYQCSILSSTSISGIQRKDSRYTNGLQRRTPHTKVLVARRRSDRNNFNPMEAIDLTMFDDSDSETETPEPLMFDGHGRGYNRTTNNLPYTHREDFDEDSEGEHDPGWLRKHTKIQIEDFTDVNEGEKEMMVMWNWHVMKKNFVGWSQMPLACEMFVDIHGDEMLQKNLYRNFVIHLCNLFDNGLLSSTQVSEISQRLQSKRKI